MIGRIRRAIQERRRVANHKLQQEENARKLAWRKDNAREVFSGRSCDEGYKSDEKQVIFREAAVEIRRLAEEYWSGFPPAEPLMKLKELLGLLLYMTSAADELGRGHTGGYVSNTWVSDLVLDILELPEMRTPEGRNGDEQLMNVSRWEASDQDWDALKETIKQHLMAVPLQSDGNPLGAFSALAKSYGNLDAIQETMRRASSRIANLRNADPSE